MENLLVMLAKATAVPCCLFAWSSRDPVSKWHFSGCGMFHLFCRTCRWYDPVFMVRPSLLNIVNGDFLHTLVPEQLASLNLGGELVHFLQSIMAWPAGLCGAMQASDCGTFILQLHLASNLGLYYSNHIVLLPSCCACCRSRLWMARWHGGGGTTGSSGAAPLAPSTCQCLTMA